jgi:hypothetical protein
MDIKNVYGKGNNMINKYLLKINIEVDTKELNEYELKKKFLQLAIITLHHNFKFNFKGVQTSDECINLNFFYNETDWIFQDVKTFNFFYPLDVDNADFIAIYKNEPKRTNIEKGHLYVFPYWMTYKFISHTKDYKQVILQGGLDTIDRPILKQINKRW